VTEDHLVRRPTFSLVVSCFNVADYLPKFLESLEHQTYDHKDVEIIFVDDGSMDETAGTIAQWIAGTTYQARLIKKTNGGLSSARNVGMAEATGKWISFPDPDDQLVANYLGDVAEAIGDYADEIHVVATNIILLDDATGMLRDVHPLRGKFKQGRQMRSLEERPDFIHLSAATGFFRLDLVREIGLQFDSHIRPNFEDAHLIARMLLSVDAPKIAVVPSAKYYYRQRSDSSSLVQNSWSRPEKYDEVLRLGVLPLLVDARELKGAVPRWLQFLALYELFFYFRADDRIHSETAGLDREITRLFNENVTRILVYIESISIRMFNATTVPRWIRTAVLSKKCGILAPEYVVVGPVDTKRGLVRLRYEYAGSAPEFEVSVGGVVVAPKHAKDRGVAYFEQIHFVERIAWVPATGTIAARVNGIPVPVVSSYPGYPKYFYESPLQTRATSWTRRTPSASSPASGTARPGQADVPDSVAVAASRKYRSRKRRSAARLLSLGRRVWQSGRSEIAEVAARLLVHALRWRPIGGRYWGAWVLVDRDVQAHDNAEHLYRYLVKRHPDINAWFALSKRSSDWSRLKAEGFRLLDYGSVRHRIALLNCSELVSAQVDHYVVAPLPERLGRHARWQFTFLQHGVTKDDLSRWLNGKRIDVCLASTPAEVQSFVGPLTPYVLTTREVALTGMPRHDRLVTLAASARLAQRKTIVFMPTWRRGLMGQTIGASNLRELPDEFWTSDYFLQWRALITAPELKQLAESYDLSLLVVPHPNLEPYIRSGAFGEDVRVVGIGESDFQATVASAAVVITDYSSNAFEAAIADRPVVYFQFDREEFFAGSHVYRRGYFDYESDGYGEVALDIDSAVAAIVAVAENGFEVADEYRRRAAEAFAVCRDGNACERVVRAISGPEVTFDM